MEIVQEPKVRRMSAIDSCHQATTGEDTADCAVANYGVCELANSAIGTCMSIYNL
jgi:hypothetical protein